MPKILITVIILVVMIVLYGVISHIANKKKKDE